jgi:hypothetical protein
MYELHVNLFQLITFYILETGEFLLGIACIATITFHGLHHLWIFCLKLIAMDNTDAAGRHED